MLFAPLCGRRRQAVSTLVILRIAPGGVDAGDALARFA
jgi:hypothetical protein